VQGTRQVMRNERERSRLPAIALAGYTNAGKSSLLSALTGAEVPVADRLFHTLDPTTRLLEVNGRSYLLTDTVGFIRKLPHQLVDAFAATLEETRRAELIVHVVDAHAPEDQLEEMTRAVEDTLEEIGAGDVPRLLALNKADLLDADMRARAWSGKRDALLVSAHSGEGLPELRERIDARFVRMLEPVELLLPHSDGSQLAELHAIAGELHREDTAQGVLVTALLPAASAARFARYATTASSNNGEPRR
jgi:GTP-binding protein HflX